MSKLIYVPLEHIDGRYTVHMDIAIEEYLSRENIEYIKPVRYNIIQETPDQSEYEDEKYMENNIFS